MKDIEDTIDQGVADEESMWQWKLTTSQVADVIGKKRNWSVPGPDHQI